MNNITKTLKETFKPRKRRAAIGGILGPIMIVVIVIAGVGVLAALFFDLADTASVVDSIDISNQAIYSEQGYVTVQVKNNGNTGIDEVYATVLVANAAGASDPNCVPGTDPALVTASTAVLTVPASGTLDLSATTLSPGESITISGGLRNVGTIASGGTISTTVAVNVGASCTGKTSSGTLEDRGEYIVQINGLSGDDVISKTITVRAR